ncbi:MAG: RrF2 family transcriptional regulator [Phycisphaeraceae bacterium]
MISQTVEYALRAVVFLAVDPDSPRTTEQIAERTRVPRGYLSKVLQQLGRAGLVQSQRGLHGGFTLVRGPAEISVLEVVNAVDPIQRIRRCPLGLESHGTQLCPLHRRLDDALAMVEEAFSSSTIADMLARPGESAPLCDVTVEGGAT